MSGVPPDPASLPRAWRPPARLNVELHEGATLSPIVPLPVGAGPIRLRFGAFDADRQVIETALHRRGRHRTEALPFVPAEEEWSGDFIFGGILWDHFGHFLLESLSRAWAFDDSSAPIVWLRRSSRSDLLAWQGAILDRLGLGHREHRLISRPTRIDRLAVPQQGAVMWRYLHPRQEARLAVHPFAAPRNGHRVWLSRSGLPEGHARVHGEEAVEDLLRADGWTILRPESVSVAEQLATLEAASMIAGFAGSAFHGLMLGRHIRAKIVIFSRHPKVEVNYAIIAAAKGLDQRIIRLDQDQSGGENVGTSFHLTRPEAVIEALQSIEGADAPGAAA